MPRHMETRLGDVTASIHFKPYAPALTAKNEAVVEVDEELAAVAAFSAVTLPFSQSGC